MAEKHIYKGFDIEAAFNKGINSDKPVVRLATNVAKEFWKTGMILGNAVAKNAPEEIKK